MRDRTALDTTPIAIPLTTDPLTTDPPDSIVRRYAIPSLSSSGGAASILGIKPCLLRGRAPSAGGGLCRSARLQTCDLQTRNGGVRLRRVCSSLPRTSLLLAMCLDAAHVDAFVRCSSNAAQRRCGEAWGCATTNSNEVWRPGLHLAAAPRAGCGAGAGFCNQHTTTAGKDESRASVHWRRIAQQQPCCGAAA